MSSTAGPEQRQGCALVSPAAVGRWHGRSECENSNLVNRKWAAMSEASEKWKTEREPPPPSSVPSPPGPRPLVLGAPPEHRILHDSGRLTGTQTVLFIRTNEL